MSFFTSPKRRAPQVLSGGMAIALLFLVAGSSSDLYGQRFAFQGGDMNMAQQMKDQLAEQKKSAMRRMTFLINEMDRNCDLSEAQTKKLSIAAKGAVSKMMSSLETTQKKQMEAMGIEMGAMDVEMAEPDFDGEVEAGNNFEIAGDGDTIIEVAGNAIGGVMAANVIINGMPGMGGGSDKPENQKIWTKSVEKILTSDQRALQDAAEANRKANARQHAVGQFVAKTDRKLLLSVEQREKIFTLLDEHFGEPLVEQAIQNDHMGGMNFFVGMGFNGGDADAPLDHQLLKDILDADQLEEWKASVEPELRNLSQRGAMPAMMAMPLGAAMNVEMGFDANAAESDDEDDE